MQQFDSFAQMQRDAALRVMAMQKRARIAVENSDPPPVFIEAPEKEEPDNISGGTELTQPPPKNTILPGLELSEEDSERALVIMILLLLMREQADERLLFALLYILM